MLSASAPIPRTPAAQLLISVLTRHPIPAVWLSYAGYWLGTGLLGILEAAEVLAPQLHTKGALPHLPHQAAKTVWLLLLLSALRQRVHWCRSCRRRVLCLRCWRRRCRQLPLPPFLRNGGKLPVRQLRHAHVPVH